MAGIDKIYFYDDNEVDLFLEWVRKNKSTIKRVTGEDIECGIYDRSYLREDSNVKLITNFSTEIDAYLWQNCDVKTVIDRLQEQYMSDIGNLNKYTYVRLQRTNIKLRQLMNIGNMILPSFTHINIEGKIWKLKGKVGYTVFSYSEPHIDDDYIYKGNLTQFESLSDITKFLSNLRDDFVTIECIYTIEKGEFIDSQILHLKKKTINGKQFWLIEDNNE